MRARYHRCRAAPGAATDASLTAVDLRPLDRADLPVARELLSRACAWDRAAEVAEEKLFGAAPGAAASAWGAFEGDRLAGVAASSARWIRLIAVDPEARRRGIGTALLSRAEDEIRKAGETTARALGQPGNYLAPGIDTRNIDTLDWLGRRGYRRGSLYTSLIVDVATNPRVTAERARTLAERSAAQGYSIRRALPADIDPMARTTEAALSKAAAFELRRAAEAQPPSLHVAFADDGAPASFAAYDGNNRGLGWFGPTATFGDHRERGLASTLLIACLLDIAATGKSHCVVAWIGPRDFYDRTVGIAGELSYQSMLKDL